MSVEDGRPDPIAPEEMSRWKTFDQSGNVTTNQPYFPATRVGWDTGPSGPVWTGPDFSGAQDAYAGFQNAVAVNARGGNNFVDRYLAPAIPALAAAGVGAIGGFGLFPGAAEAGAAGGAVPGASMGGTFAGEGTAGFGTAAGSAGLAGGLADPAGVNAFLGTVPDAVPGTTLMVDGQLIDISTGLPVSAGMGGGGVQQPAGGAGNTPLDPTAPAAAGAGEVSFIPAVNNVQALQNATLFGVNSPTAADIALSGPGAPFSTSLGGGGPIAAGGGDLAGMGALDTYLGSGAPGASTVADEVLKKIKEGGGNALDWVTKNPAQAAMLGISAANALSKPKLPEAAQAVQKANTPNLSAASGVVNAGGASGPAWQQQKTAIDSQIDRQIAEKKQQILQQAQSSGMGVDSLVTIQQIQKMTEQMEGLRQQQYMQAQAQNVQVALSELGMSNQALSTVAGQQFAGSKEAQSSAAQTAQLALMMSQMTKPTANQQPAA